MIITSVQNKQVKWWRKLKQRKFRERTETFLVEGYHIIEEVRHSNWEILQFIIPENSKVPEWISADDVIIVSDHVFHHITYTKKPQGIAAIIKMKQFTDIKGQAILLVDEIQDPGNVGTIIRTADAAGYDGIILGEGTVDLYNDKVIRATQGSLFHVPIIQANLKQKVVQMKSEGFTILTSALRNATNYTDIAIPNQFALIVGNESAGVNKNLQKMADELINIPIYGEAESLNVSVAAGILMYALKK